MVFSLTPLHPASSAASFPCFLLLAVVALVHSLDGVVFLSVHLW